jgi:hypothetical protein
MFQYNPSLYTTIACPEAKIFHLPKKEIHGNVRKKSCATGFSCGLHAGANSDGTAYRTKDFVVFA